MPNFCQWNFWMGAIGNSLQAEVTVLGDPYQVLRMFKPHMLGNAWIKRDALPKYVWVRDRKLREMDSYLVA